MSEIIGVRFREIGKISYYPCQENNISVKDFVIVLTKRGLENGTVIIKKDTSENLFPPNNEERIVRKATTKDLEIIHQNRQSEKKFYNICKEKIKEHKLRMKLISVEYLFDRTKLIFYFVAEGRVDFRNFVRELAYIFKTRIELRQIGVRDEAKMLGGLGSCGKPLCCATFLNDFQAVSVKMAKDQGLSLNPAKISGICGRLMCCLKYEEDSYLDILYNMPRIGSMVNTPEGTGKVVSYNVISRIVKVELNSSKMGTPVSFKLQDLSTIE